MNKIYIAGALFTHSERLFLEKIESICLNLGFDTYLPHKDCGLFTRDDDKSNCFFYTDRDNIDNSDIIIAIINGLDIDSGTSWEIGYGYSKQKVIIGYLDDIRIFNVNRQLNPMIFNSLNYIASDIDSIKELLSLHK